jgi:phosphoribosylformimino-5-aminoimidazole carboxamide ribotide isomerase
MTSTYALPVVPVIDLMDGQVVRAVRGERSAYRPIESRLVAGSAPCAVAAALLARVAAPALYVADLDALLGGVPQVDVLHDLLRALPGHELWLDAGFADVPAADALVQRLGADAARLRCVFGSESLASRAALAAAAGRPGAILSLDFAQARPLDPAGCRAAPELWPASVIVMTLDRVGSGAGPDLAAFAELRARAPGRRWIGAGGVRDAADLRAAAACGADAWLVASALHDGGLG